LALAPWLDPLPTGPAAPAASAAGCGTSVRTGDDNPPTLAGVPGSVVSGRGQWQRSVAKVESVAEAGGRPGIRRRGDEPNDPFAVGPAL